MEFSRQEYWNGLQFPPSGDLPDPVIEPLAPGSLALANRFLTTVLPGKPHINKYIYIITLKYPKQTKIDPVKLLKKMLFCELVYGHFHCNRAKFSIDSQWSEEIALSFYIY